MPSNEILQQIKDCPDPRRLAVLVSRMEDIYTPLDFADALGRSAPIGNGHPLGRTIIWQQLRDRQPERYRRSVIAPDITLLSDPDHPPSGKTLILGWTGRGGRLGLPVVSFVQLLPSRLFDIVVLRDPLRVGYTRGIEGYADGQFALVSRLRTDFSFDRYARVVSLGASAGGMPALRAAHLLATERGVSLCGLFHWHIPGLLGGANVADAPAYDVLCACRNPSPARLIGVYGELNERDRRHVDILASRCKVERYAVPAISDHSVLFELLKVGKAQAFLKHVLTS